MRGLGGVLRRGFAGEGQLWKIWWLGAIPVAASVTALTFLGDSLRFDGQHGWGNFVDVLKLLVYAAWFSAAWRSAHREVRLLTRFAGRLAVATGVLTAALTV